MGFLDSGGNALLLRLHNGDCNGWMQVREREGEKERERGREGGRRQREPTFTSIEWRG